MARRINRYLAKILRFSSLDKTFIVLVAVVICIAFTFLFQSGYTLDIPMQASLFLSTVCIILPLIGGFFVYKSRRARIMLASALIASFCALNFVIDMQTTTYLANRRCQSTYHGKLWVDSGAINCLWDDGVTEGQITPMGSAFTYSILLIIPFLSTLVLGLCNAVMLPIAFVSRKIHTLV